MNSIKHTWINYPTRSIRKCTRCGCIVKDNMILSDGKKGKLYTKHFIEYEHVAPNCIKL